MHSPFFGLASTLFLDHSPIHTGPHIYLSPKALWSTLPQTLLDIFLKYLPLTGLQTLMMPLPRYLGKSHCSYLASNAFSLSSSGDSRITYSFLSGALWLFTHILSLQIARTSYVLAQLCISQGPIFSQHAVLTMSASTLLLLTPELKQVSTVTKIFLRLVL